MDWTMIFVPLIFSIIAASLASSSTTNEDISSKFAIFCIAVICSIISIFVAEKTLEERKHIKLEQIDYKSNSYNTWNEWTE